MATGWVLRGSDDWAVLSEMDGGCFEIPARVSFEASEDADETKKIHEKMWVYLYHTILMIENIPLGDVAPLPRRYDTPLSNIDDIPDTIFVLRLVDRCVPSNWLWWG